MKRALSNVRWGPDHESSAKRPPLPPSEEVLAHLSQLSDGPEPSSAQDLLPSPISLDLDAPTNSGVDVGEQDLQPMDIQPTQETDVTPQSMGYWPAFEGAETLELPRPSNPGSDGRVVPSAMLQPKRKLAPIQAEDQTDYAAGREWLKEEFQGFQGPTSDPGRQRVDLMQYGAPSKVPDKITEETKVEMAGANQSGKYPDLGEEYMLPEGANYEGQYSSRVLTYLSTVSRSALELEGLPPVEVQFGHAFNEDAYQLFASTNNLVTQARLAEMLADPTAMVKNVGLATSEDYRGGWAPKPTDSDLPQSEVDARAKHALKLAAFPELQERRRENAGDDEARLRDLGLADKAFQAFIHGEITVASSPSNKTERKKGEEAFHATAEEKLRRVQRSLPEKQRTWSGTVRKYEQDLGEWERNGGKKDDKPSPPARPTTSFGDTRHAEQNVADAMHATNAQRIDEGEAPFTHADIQGTMIRCTGCSAEVGANLVDDEDVELTGRLFAKQASLEHFCADCLLKKEGTRQTVTSTHPVQVPGSPGSPVPSVWDEQSDDEDSVVQPSAFVSPETDDLSQLSRSDGTG